MHLTYGNVDLKIVRFLECTRTSEYDPSGVDYLFTRWRIVVEAIYTPTEGINYPYTVASTTSNPLQGADTASVGNVRQSAPYTDVALRHALTTPRRQLSIKFNSGDNGAEQTWLHSPSSQQYKIDLINGPLPFECSVTEVRGQGKLFLVRFGIETATNDCGFAASGNILYLLSNRWTCNISSDEDYFETRTFEGLAIFRADIMHRDSFHPDAFRLFLLPPTPFNCKRNIIALTALPDGHSFQYKIEDVEQPVVYLDQPVGTNAGSSQGRNKRNVTRIDAIVKRNYSQVGSKAAMSAVVESMQSAMYGAQAFSGIFQQAKGGEIQATSIDAATAMQYSPLSTALGAGVNAYSAALTIANNILPVFTETAMCEVWGNRYALKKDLQYLAFAVCFGQLTTYQKEFNTLNGSSIANTIRIAEQSIGGALSVIQNKLASTAGVQTSTFGQITGIITGASIIGKVVNTQNIQDAARALVAGVNTATRFLFNTINDIVPASHFIELEYDVFRKRVRVTVSQEASGLVDWITARQGYGRRSITEELKDEVIGGNWPQFFTSTPRQFLNNSSPALPTFLNSAGTGDTLPPVRDAGILIGTLSPRGAGIGPPLDNTARTGSLLELVAADIMTTCASTYLIPISGQPTISPVSNVITPSNLPSLVTTASPINAN